jgi:hypothetical protein
MNSRLWGIFVAVAIGVLAVPSQAVADKAPAALTIDITGSPGDYSYSGTIISPKPICKKDRKITVFRRQPGSDEKIGSVRSFPSLDSEDKNWYWAVPATEEPNGFYYAKAGATNRCKKAKSGVIGVAPRRADANTRADIAVLR